MAVVELLLDARARIGESPTWLAEAGALFWIDVKAPALHRLNPHGESRRWELGSDIGAFALLEDGLGAVVALRYGLFRLDFASGGTELIEPPPFDPNLFRFNEGICDARGRFWIGVMFDPLTGIDAKPGTAALHHYSLTEGLIAVSDRSNLHNGFAWSKDEGTFFWSHSNERRIYRSRYDLDSGALERAEPFVVVGADQGLPDGAAVDEEGCYWCAMHGAGRLHRYDATGTLVSQIPLPVSQPTMCAFVGPFLDEMVVTSARENLTAAELEREPHAGAIFRLRPGVRGVPRPCLLQ